MLSFSCMWPLGWSECVEISLFSALQLTVPVLCYREAGRGAAALRHAAERAAVVAGRAEGEHGQRAGPEEEEDGIRPVAAGEMQTQEHQGSAAGLLRVLPQPHPAAELPGAHHMHTHQQAFLCF